MANLAYAGNAIDKLFYLSTIKIRHDEGERIITFCNIVPISLNFILYEIIATPFFTDD